MKTFLAFVLGLVLGAVGVLLSAAAALADAFGRRLDVIDVEPEPA